MPIFVLSSDNHAPLDMLENIIVVVVFVIATISCEMLDE